MLHQLARSEPLVRRQLPPGACQIFHHGLLFNAEISMTHFRPHFFRFDLVETSVDRNARNPVLQRHVPRKLRQLLEYFNENHLAEIFLRGSTRSMRTDDFDNQRIKPSHQHASCLIVILKRSLNQRACVRIIHVIESASTPLTMTGSAALWLQLLAESRLCQASVTANVGTALVPRH